MAAYPKPLPEPDADSRPFWAGCAEGRLLIQQCGACAAHRFPPAAACPKCGAAEAAWTQASGRATVYSWIVVTHPVPADVYGAEVPYVVALVELEEGVRLPTNIIGCEPRAVTAGMAVEVTFDKVTDDVTLPKFRPARADHD